MLWKQFNTWIEVVTIHFMIGDTKVGLKTNTDVWYWLVDLVATILPRVSYSPVGSQPSSFRSPDTYLSLQSRNSCVCVLISGVMTSARLRTSKKTPTDPELLKGSSMPTCSSLGGPGFYSVERLPILPNSTPAFYVRCVTKTSWRLITYSTVASC